MSSALATLVSRTGEKVQVPRDAICGMSPLIADLLQEENEALLPWIETHELRLACTFCERYGGEGRDANLGPPVVPRPIPRSGYRHMFVQWPWFTDEFLHMHVMGLGTQEERDERMFALIDACNQMALKPLLEPLLAVVVSEVQGKTPNEIRTRLGIPIRSGPPTVEHSEGTDAYGIPLQYYKAVSVIELQRKLRQDPAEYPSSSSSDGEDGSGGEDGEAEVEEEWDAQWQQRHQNQGEWEEEEEMDVD